MNEIYDLLKRAYSSVLAEDVQPESPADIIAFEERYNTKIPKDYCWLIKEFGACNFAKDPFLYSLEELEYEYPGFVENYEEYKEGYDMPKDLDPFPIGGFGDGSTAVLDRKTSKIFKLIHDCVEDLPLEEVFENLMELMKSHANSIIEFGK